MMTSFLFFGQIFAKCVFIKSTLLIKLLQAIKKNESPSVFIDLQKTNVKNLKMSARLFRVGTHFDPGPDPKLKMLINWYIASRCMSSIEALNWRIMLDGPLDSLIISSLLCKLEICRRRFMTAHQSPGVVRQCFHQKAGQAISDRLCVPRFNRGYMQYSLA